MINVGMTIREMVSIASNGSCSGDLYERIIKALELATGNEKLQALELATGNEKLLVGCNGVKGESRYDTQYWDHKIPAIESLRLATGMGLKDAKDWVEDVQYHSGTKYTGPLDPEVAQKLCDELKKCGMDCWTTNS
jgi:ribosomal protein L7/L12